jgi:transporter family-2 protein
MWLVNGRPPISGVFSVTPKIALLGGVIGAFITYTVVQAISQLGVAKAEIIIVVTQVAVAYVIELFGLFGSDRAELSWVKIAGILVAMAGVGIYSFGGK